MYFGNVEIDIGNKSDIVDWITLIFILIIGVALMASLFESKFWVLIPIGFLGFVFSMFASNYVHNSEASKRLENSSKNIYAAITDYYKETKEINIKNNSYGEFISEGKTYRFFIEDNNLHIKDIDEDLETIVDGKYY